MCNSFEKLVRIIKKISSSLLWRPIYVSFRAWSERKGCASGQLTEKSPKWLTIATHQPNRWFARLWLTNLDESLIWLFRRCSKDQLEFLDSTDCLRSQGISHYISLYRMRRLDIWEKLRAGGDFWRIFSVSSFLMLQTLALDVLELESSFQSHSGVLVVRNRYSDEVFRKHLSNCGH